MPGNGQLEVFVDGSCPFCQAVQARAERWDTRKRIRFMDYHDPAIAAEAPFPRERLDAEMHVRTGDGAWHAGFAGWTAILRELPRLGWLGWLFGTPLFRLAGPSVYRWVARHRYALPGFPPPCDAAACPLPSQGVRASPAALRPHSR